MSENSLMVKMPIAVRPAIEGFDQMAVAFKQAAAAFTGLAEYLPVSKRACNRLRRWERRVMPDKFDLIQRVKHGNNCAKSPRLKWRLTKKYRSQLNQCE